MVGAMARAHIGRSGETQAGHRTRGVPREVACCLIRVLLSARGSLSIGQKVADKSFWGEKNLTLTVCSTGRVRRKGRDGSAQTGP